MICYACGAKFSDDKSQCPKCHKFIFREQIKEMNGIVKRLSEADDISLDRLQSGPWDLCFGPANGREKDGIVRTSATLIAGKPGAGKSTLSAQLIDTICGSTEQDGLYICSEESIPEVRLRAKRLDVKNMQRICCVSTLTSSEALMQLESIITSIKPCAAILDSLQGLTGNDLQSAVEVCKLMKSFSVRYKFPSIIIDHVNKKGEFAGREDLQHDVDTTMTLFPSDINPNIRELETEKNRFGQAFVTVFLEMTETGLVLIDIPDDEKENEKDD